MFYLDTEDEVKDVNAIVVDNLSVSHLYDHVLFDLGTSHSFINLKFVKKFACKAEEMEVWSCPATPLGPI